MDAPGANVDEDIDREGIGPVNDRSALEAAARVREQARRRPVVRRIAPPRPSSQPAWWVGKDRDGFAGAAAQRAEQLRTSPDAAKVKTPVNFVE